MFYVSGQLSKGHHLLPCTDELDVGNSATNYLGPEYHEKFVMRAEN